MSLTSVTVLGVPEVSTACEFLMGVFRDLARVVDDSTGTETTSQGHVEVRSMLIGQTAVMLVSLTLNNEWSVFLSYLSDG